MDEVVFSQAETGDQLSQVHELNHAIFAEELGQHPATETRTLIDRFDPENTYFLASRAGEVLGMIAVNLSPPFSIEKRLPDPTLVHTRFREACEVRLLCIRPGERKRMILAGLFWKVYEHASVHRRSHILISGIAQRRETYGALGFEELGPGIAEGMATFIPMALDLKDARLMQKARQFHRWWARRTGDDRSGTISLMPGPVEVSPAVRETFKRPAISHRGETFLRAYKRVRGHLSMLTGGMPVAILSGSGTLANDAIAMALKACFGESRGLVLANGEFGERLCGHATRAGLSYKSLKHAWGARWDHAQIVESLNEVCWVWGVHLETSTGQVNDLQWLSQICGARGIALAADCVSSVGALPLHSSLKLAFASGVSGKSLAAYAGIAFMFVAPEMLVSVPWDRLPSTFDLARNIEERQPVFTLASSPLLALEAALRERYADLDAATLQYKERERLGVWLRGRLRECGFPVLVDDDTAAPVICTIPAGEELIGRARACGFQIAHESCYLKTRGWAQIATMGAVDAHTLQLLIDSVHRGSDVRRA